MANVSGIIKTLIPTRGTEDLTKQVRVDATGTQFVLESLLQGQVAALEGSKFVARATPAVGATGVVLGSFPTVFSDTLKIAVVLRNREATGGKYLIPDYIRGRVKVAGVTTTSVEARAEVDTTDRYTSGGTTLTTFKTNPSTSAPTSLAVCTVGDITAPAASANRQHVGHVLMQKKTAPCLIIDEQHLFTFGALGQSATNKVARDLTTVATDSVYPFSGCAVPPGGTFLFQIATIAGDTTPVQFDFEVGWTER